jgi:hypothetical protein
MPHTTTILQDSVVAGWHGGIDSITPAAAQRLLSLFDQASAQAMLTEQLLTVAGGDSCARSGELSRRGESAMLHIRDLLRGRAALLERSGDP